MQLLNDIGFLKCIFLYSNSVFFIAAIFSFQFKSIRVGNAGVRSFAELVKHQKVIRICGMLALDCNCLASPNTVQSNVPQSGKSSTGENFRFGV